MRLKLCDGCGKILPWDTEPGISYAFTKVIVFRQDVDNDDAEREYGPGPGPLPGANLEGEVHWCTACATIAANAVRRQRKMSDEEMGR
jgi:hypothetical protein